MNPHNDHNSIIFPIPYPSIEGIKDFLSSKYFKGIGKVYATKIADKLGTKILRENFNPEEVERIEGLSKKATGEFIDGWKSLKHSPQLLAFLFSCGLSASDIEKIFSHYKAQTEKIISEDPYQMVEEVFKLSFFTADKIGRKLGIYKDDPRRLRGALLTAVKIYAEHGNMFAKEREAIATAARIAGVNSEIISHEINELIREERLIKSHDGLYLPVYYNAEKEGAKKLAHIVKTGKKEIPCLDLPEFDQEGHSLSSGQQKAIDTVARYPVTVITGGPGTGKTTTVRGIIQLLEDMGKEVVLAAPTGRAAKRISDLAGKEAKTLHRLLGYSRGKGYKNKNFKTDILIIDEASMLEQVMFNHLLQAVDPDTKIVLVGDTDQLPAIGAGDVLRDMIKSGTIPVVTLYENFRQHEGSSIPSNAASIIEGEAENISNGSDFMIITENTAKNIHDRLLNLIKEELPLKYKINSRDIQIVTPQQEGPLGAKQLNIDIQATVNPDSPGITHGMKDFRLGDRVMQTSNSSIRHIYNGETGWISAIDPEREWIEVTFFDGKKSLYTKKELKELSLAYATTVHKLQGSETDYLVMPMTMNHKQMLYRNLLYTGVSRAKKLCVLVGEEKAIRTAINNPAPAVRNSNFKLRLREYLPIIPA